MANHQITEREKAIERFKRYHGNHSLEVVPMLDIEAMIRVAEHYRGRVDFTQYPTLNEWEATMRERPYDKTLPLSEQPWLFSKGRKG